MSAQFLCHPKPIGTNVKVREVGGVAAARIPVETEAGSVAWFGGLRYITIPVYLPLGSEGEDRSRASGCHQGGRRVGEC